MGGIQVSIQWRGVESALAGLTAKKEQSNRALTQGIQRVALYFRDTLVMFAQAGHPDHPNVVTGNLSGHMSYEMDGTTAYVGATPYYAPFVEFGTSRARAYPFFRPAVLDVFDSGDAQRLFSETVKEILG